MKKITGLDKPTVRETCVTVRGRPLVVMVSSHSIRLGQKGRRRQNYYDVPVEAIYHLGAKIVAAERRRAKKERKDGR